MAFSGYNAGQAAAFSLDAADGLVDGTYYGNRVLAGSGYATTQPSVPVSNFASTVPSSFTGTFPTTSSSVFPTTSLSSTFTAPSAFPPIASSSSVFPTTGLSSTFTAPTSFAGATVPFTGAPTTTFGSTLGATTFGATSSLVPYSGGLSTFGSSVTSFGSTYGGYGNVRVIGEREVRIRVPIFEQVPVPRVQVVDVPVHVNVPQIVYVEKPVYVDKPVEKIVYVDKPEEKIVYVDKPAPPRPAPVAPPPPQIHCASCNQLVTNDLFEAEGRQWHRGCYVACAGCQRFIERALLIEAEGRSWHRDCYKICGSCGRTINDQPFKFGGKIYHKSCMNICGGCMAVIEGQPYIVGGRKFHQSCYNGKWTGRDIYVIVDSSASMASQDTSDAQRRRYWHIARDAVMNHIVPKAVQYDSDGITLYFFDSKFTVYNSVNNANKVSELFQQYQPTGGTALHKVLHDAFTRHFTQTHDPRKPATLLIITDGAPDSKEAAEQELIQAAMNIKADYELSIMFVQIGPDPGATQFLQYLDDQMSHKTGGRDIVDVVKSWEMKGLTFEELIAKSIAD